MNHFALQAEEYVRNIDYLGAWRRDMITYISTLEGVSVEEAAAFVDAETAPGGQFELQDPKVLCMTKVKDGQREPQEITLTEYFADLRDGAKLMSPTMAVYINPKFKRSLLAKYISGNIARRARSKHEMFEYGAAGNELMRETKEIEQSGYKTKNNSLSGAHSSPYTPLFLKSAHSTLTSTCRCASGYGNANNEKFLLGNRHYSTPNVTKGNITSIINNTDYAVLEAALTKYGIRAPTVEETIRCVRYSTDLYWHNAIQSEEIAEYISKLSDLQRSAFVYTGDMYHLAIINRDVVYKFLDRLSTRAETPIENPDLWVKGMDADLTAFVSMLFADRLLGSAIKDAKVESPETYALIAATAKNVLDVLDDYSDMIKALWVTPNVPASIASLPSSIRRTAITSDTDSTIFTVQWWTEWFTGSVNFGAKSNAIRDTTIYLASQTIIHLLARMTGNMGVIPSQRFQLVMKNEFSFPFFSLTSRSKHYYANQGAREGLLSKKFTMEVKGVALKSSNCPPHVMKQLNALIQNIIETVLSGKLLSAYEILGTVAGIENDIRRSVLAGESTYLKSGSIKIKESYRNPESSNFQHYLMWEEVFAEKYGHTEPPTYSVIKVSLDADNKTKINEWLALIEDREMADKIRQYLTSKGKTSVNTLLLPMTICKEKGIPVELICGIDIRKIIYNTMESFYLILESLGLYMMNPHRTRLVSDDDFYDSLPPATK